MSTVAAPFSARCRPMSIRPPGSGRLRSEVEDLRGSGLSLAPALTLAVRRRTIACGTSTVADPIRPVPAAIGPGQKLTQGIDTVRPDLTVPCMAGITTIGHSTSIPALFDHYYFTLSLLTRHPLARALAPELEAIRPDLDAGHVQEQRLIWNQYDADAAVKLADQSLDGIADGVDSTLRIDLKGDRTSPVYLRYFGSRRPSELKRPYLGVQLEIMRGWPPSLVESGNPILQQYGVQLMNTITEADAAAAAKQRASQELTDFRVTGMRARLIDRFNAVRKSIYGQLGQIQHANPSLGSGWAESFFRSGGGSERVTLAEIERRIASAEIDLAALRKQRDELVAQEEREAQAQAEAEQAEKRARIEAARAAMAELAAEIDELEGDLEPAPAPDAQTNAQTRRR